MITGVLKVTPERLAVRVDEFNKRFQAVNHMRESLLKAVQQFSGECESEAMQVYYSKLEKFDDKMAPFRETTREYISELREVPASIWRAEFDNRRIIGSLDTDHFIT